MSHKVLAWTLDSDAFHRWLTPRVVKASELDVAALAAAAAEVAWTRAPSVMSYFEGLRIHPDEPESWDHMFALDDDTDCRDELYAVAMAGHLHVAAQMSFWSHSLAGVVLSKLGWEGEPSLLWLGHGLGALAQASGNSVLASALSNARSALGGWLSLEEAREGLARLVGFRAKSLPADMRPWFEGTMFAALSPDELRDRVENALTELTTVMADAVNRGESLRLVFWS